MLHKPIHARKKGEKVECQIKVDRESFRRSLVTGESYERRRGIRAAVTTKSDIAFEKHTTNDAPLKQLSKCIDSESCERTGLLERKSK